MLLPAFVAACLFFFFALLRFFLFQYCDHFRRSHNEIPHGIVFHISCNKIGIVVPFLHGDFIKDDIILIDKDFTGWFREYLDRKSVV